MNEFCANEHQALHFFFTPANLYKTTRYFRNLSLQHPAFNLKMLAKEVNNHIEELQLQNAASAAELSMHSSPTVTPAVSSNRRKPSACNICGKVFSRYDNLERHRRTHQVVKETVPAFVRHQDHIIFHQVFLELVFSTVTSAGKPFLRLHMEISTSVYMQLCCLTSAKYVASLSRDEIT
ncbi:KRAB [Acanthosepion pharaonis]|uniref:KRAB n=1 Tax=Acanthosepion pharaonis TaxID=158019 RepID=A0A812BUX0_ACAPH|nr:KRAB [Sepia pharaonis]